MSNMTEIILLDFLLQEVTPGYSLLEQSKIMLDYDGADFFLSIQQPYNDRISMIDSLV